MIKGQNPHVRIVDNVGDDCYWMLQIYLMVQKVVHDEIMYSFQSTSSDSPLGEVEDWSNHIGCRQALKIERSVSEAAHQMTPSFPGLGQGCCKCGAIKSLKFKWKEEPIPHPSFFWGCVKYTMSDRSLHDSAKSCSDSIWEALNLRLQCWDYIGKEDIPKFLQYTILVSDHRPNVRKHFPNRSIGIEMIPIMGIPVIYWELKIQYTKY